jgi:hypothetical protein
VVQNLKSSTCPRHALAADVRELLPIMRLPLTAHVRALALSTFPLK